jgi:hypothetical protein
MCEFICDLLHVTGKVEAEWIRMVGRAAKCTVDDVVEGDLSKCSNLDYGILHSGTECLG